MKSLICAIILILTTVYGYSQSATQGTICVSADCKYSFQLPVDTVTLHSLGTSTVGGISVPITGYVWKAPAGVTLDNVTAQNTVARGLNTPGTYVFSVTASSSVGFASVNDTVIVLGPNKIPVAIINASGTPALTTLNGSASLDSDGVISNYAWSGPGLSATSGPIVTISNIAQGSYTYTLTVTDNQGATNTAIIRVFVSTPFTGNITVVAIMYVNGKTVTVYSNGTSTTQ